MDKDLFEIDLDNINVEDIMRQIREKIARENIQEEILYLDKEFGSSTLFREHLRLTNLSCNIISYKAITSHRKLTGKIIVLIKKLIRKSIYWYINPMIEQQNEFNANVTRTLNCLADEIENLNEEIKKNKEDILNNAWTKNIDIQEGKLAGEVIKETERSKEIEKIKELDNLTCKLIQQEEEIQKLYSENTFNSSRLRRIERQLRNKDITIKEPHYITSVQEKIDFDYFLFEERYRGSEDQIRERLSIYTKYFKGKHNILDIGCGRGEFLEILKHEGITAIGLEVDEDMIMICEEKQLHVVNQDAISYLESIEDCSLGGIILTQVIEHLSPNQLINLIQLAYQKLEKDAYFIAETINPQSLIVFTEAYFMDLSHIRMIHPLTLKFLVEGEGFKQTELCYLSKVGEELRIPQVENLPVEFNEAIGKLNDVVYGYRDYAIVGRK